MIRKSFINSLCVTAFTTLFVIMLTLTGCGKRVEAVITTEGEDITDVAKQYEELPVSKAEKFSYDDLKAKVSEEKRQKLESLHVVSEDENAYWLIDYWCKKDIKGLIQMPFSRRWIMHIEACLRIKDKLQSI